MSARLRTLLLASTLGLGLATIVVPAATATETPAVAAQAVTDTVPDVADTYWTAQRLAAATPARLRVSLREGAR